MTKLDTILKKLIGILGWLKLMNATLLSGATWSSGSKTIKDISKYSIFYIRTNAGNGYAYRYADYIEFESGAKVGSISWSTYMIINLSGDTATITDNNSIDHSPGNVHGTVITTAQIFTIIGVLPAWGGGIVKALFSILSAISLDWRWQHDKAKHNTSVDIKQLYYPYIWRWKVYKTWETGHILDSCYANVWRWHSMGRRVLSSMHKRNRFSNRTIHRNTFGLLFKRRRCHRNFRRRICIERIMFTIFLQCRPSYYLKPTKGRCISYRPLEVASLKGGVCCA